MTRTILKTVAAAAIALTALAPAKATEINDSTACSVEQSVVLNADDTDETRLGEYEVSTFEFISDTAFDLMMKRGNEGVKELVLRVHAFCAEHPRATIKQAVLDAFRAMRAE
jgi:hypothetical protein